MSPRSRWLVTLSVGLFALHVAAAPLRAGDDELRRLLPRIDAPAGAFVKGPENARLRVLIVVDTDDQAGITWGRDGANMKALLEASFEKQKLADRVTVDFFFGKQVMPDKILAYYRALKVEPNDALLFYYSGHGGFQLSKGHFLALTHGILYRKDLIAAMDAGNPKLRVLLTDCCSNYAGGAFPGEPTGAVVLNGLRKDFGSTPAARREEPSGKVSELRKIEQRRPNQPPRPNSNLNPGTFPKAKTQEPASSATSLQRVTPRNAPRAKREEPAIAVDISTRIKYSSLPTLTTHKGKVPMVDIVESNDSAVLRDLLFRHVGLVDINGCTKGDSSFGEIGWGGSLFTNSLIALQKSTSADFDKNGNRVVEWSEFFPLLKRSTKEVSGRVSGNRFQQVPEANQLGTPIVP